MAKYSKGAQKNVESAMHRAKRGKLTSGRSGKKVTSRKQAIAIGLSEAREKGAKVPNPPRTRGKKAATKKRATKKTATKKSSVKKAATKRAGTKRAVKKAARKSTGRTKTARKKSTGRTKTARKKSAGKKAASKGRRR